MCFCHTKKIILYSDVKTAAVSIGLSVLMSFVVRRASTRKLCWSRDWTDCRPAQRYVQFDCCYKTV